MQWKHLEGDPLGGFPTKLDWNFWTRRMRGYWSAKDQWDCLLTNLVQPPHCVPGREMLVEQVAYKGHQDRTGAQGFWQLVQCGAFCYAGAKHPEEYSVFECLAAHVQGSLNCFHRGLLLEKGWWRPVLEPQGAVQPGRGPSSSSHPAALSSLLLPLFLLWD